MSAPWVIGIALGWLAFAIAIAPAVGRRLRRNQPPRK